MFFYKVYCPEKLPKHILEGDKTMFTISYTTMDGKMHSIQKASYDQFMQVLNKSTHMYTATCYLVEPSSEDRTYLKLSGISLELVSTFHLEVLIKIYLSNSFEVQHIWPK